MKTDNRKTEIYKVMKHRAGSLRIAINLTKLYD